MPTREPHAMATVWLIPALPSSLTLDPQQPVPKDRRQASSPRATFTFLQPGDEGIMNPIHYTGEEAQRC